MLVYRDRTTLNRSANLVSDLVQALDSAHADGCSALLQAGMLECALTDLGHPGQADARSITDAIAAGWLGERSQFERARKLVTRLILPDTLVLKVPEGYAFYALDPRSYAAMVREYCQRRRTACAVVGVRSVGTSLSAVVRCELARHGVPAVRCTVRPDGHPLNRSLQWPTAERQLLTGWIPHAHYIVVDEGPGLSGSTFLAVGEALLGLGIAPERVAFFCSHAPDPQRFVARDGSARAARFAWHAASAWRPPRGALDLSGGAWRSILYSADESWPACWTGQERAKYLTADRQHFVKFGGFTPFDREPLQRSEQLARAGWSPAVLPGEPGFLAYRWLRGRPAARARDREIVLPLLARYLAFRTRAFPQSASDAALETMMRVNLLEDSRIELPESLHLEVRSPVHVDGRLMPHEWLMLGQRAIKTDAVDHGDDHLFPGPADIAWDLAGAVVEWALNAPETAALLTNYRSLTGDDASRRLPHYVLAYTAFRLGGAAFAHDATAPEERQRWCRLRNVYRVRLFRTLQQLGLTSERAAPTSERFFGQFPRRGGNPRA